MWLLTESHNVNDDRGTAFALQVFQVILKIFISNLPGQIKSMIKLTIDIIGEELKNPTGIPLAHMIPSQTDVYQLAYQSLLTELRISNDPYNFLKTVIKSIIGYL